MDAVITTAVTLKSSIHLESSWAEPISDHFWGRRDISPLLRSMSPDQRPKTRDLLLHELPEHGIVC